MNHLFLISIGPVQSFIAQARKTQDLYGASKLLSNLTHEAMKVAQEKGITLIFPKAIGKSGDISLPNRFIGKINGKTAQELQEIGQAIENAVQALWHGKAEKALNDVTSRRPFHFDNQVSGFLDINWLFHPIVSDSEVDYRDAYKQIEALMAAVKNIRVFNQNEEQGRKCNLDGERNALFFGEGTCDRYVKQGCTVSNKIWIESNEGLSAISMVKRHFGKDLRFPSTAEIALMDFLKDKKDSFYRAFFNGSFDEQLCYEENLNSKYFEKNGLVDVIEKCGGLICLKEARRGAYGSKDLPKYYAVLAFDGDKMGKLMSGARLKEDAESGLQDLKIFQGHVSSLLTAFAVKAYEIVEKPLRGRIAYTGGDDFVGFINLEHLFNVVKELRYAFDEEVNQKLKGNNKDSLLLDSFTFSAGIAIAHYKMPLSMVLKKVRKLEITAKIKGERDAFAIGVLKHSGEIHEAYFKWNLIDRLPQWNALHKLVLYLKNDCSETFIRSLDREFRYLTDHDGKIKHPKLIGLEILRLVKKSLKDDKKGNTAEVSEVVELLLTTETKRDGKIANALNFIEALKIALFIKRKMTSNDEFTN